LLILWCVGDMCDMVDNDDDLGRSRRPGAEDRRLLNISRVLSGRTIRRSNDIVYGQYRAQGDDERGFLG
jgi:hypothetical protein